MNSIMTFLVSFCCCLWLLNKLVPHKMTINYQYMKISVSKDNLVPTLNTYGASGWELIDKVYEVAHDKYVCILKKENFYND
jgi:hypothetical protein